MSLYKRLSTPFIIDGGFSDWSNWTACSSVDGGFKLRTRSCSKPAPLNGGSDCEGNTIDLSPCSYGKFIC